MNINIIILIVLLFCSTEQNDEVYELMDETDMDSLQKGTGIYVKSPYSPTNVPNFNIKRLCRSE